MTSNLGLAVLTLPLVCSSPSSLSVLMIYWGSRHKQKKESMQCVREYDILLRKGKNNFKWGGQKRPH